MRPNDTAELNALVSRAAKQIAAVVVEPVVGTGTIPLTDEYVAELLRLRAEHGFLLIADEVATGFGRTGSFFASQRWPEQPDLLITSKGLTNGTCPASAVIVSQRVADAFTEHDAVLSHAETQGATPLTCAAISATIAEMRRLDAVAAGQALGEKLGAGIAELMAEMPQICKVGSSLAAHRTPRRLPAAPGAALVAQSAAERSSTRPSGWLVRHSPTATLNWLSPVRRARTGRRDPAEAIALSSHPPPGPCTAAAT